MDLKIISEYKNKIATIEKREQKINEDKITLRAQIDQTRRYRDEKVAQLKALDVDYDKADDYVAEKKRDILALEQNIRDILDGRTVRIDCELDNISMTAAVTEPVKDEIDLDSDVDLNQPAGNSFGNDLPF